MNEAFRKFSNWVSEVTGSSWAFIVAIAVIAGWGISGPMFRFSDTWQLVINTGTTIVTFLMVFLIQNTQNRDSKALHLKLDELLRAVEGARTGMVDLENCTDDELRRLQEAFHRLREHHAETLDQCAEEMERKATDAGRRAAQELLAEDEDEEEEAREPLTMAA